MRNRIVLALTAVAVVLILPLVFSRESQISLMNACGIMIIFALSYNILLGQTGLLSFGHAVYFGVPAFAAIHIMNMAEAAKLPLPLPLLPLASGAVGFLLAALLGSISTKRGGVTFAMITLGLGELIYASAPILPALFGGEDGIRADRTALLPVLGVRFGTSLQMYYLISVWIVIVIAILYAVSRSPIGYLLKAVKENPQRTEFLGFSAPRVRYTAVLLSGLVAGVAGGLAAANYEIVTYASINATQSGSALLMVYLGGSGVFWGPVLGATIVTILQTALSDYTQAWALYFGLLFMFVVLYMPAGLSWWLSSHWKVLRAGEGARLLGPYMIIVGPIVAFVTSVIFMIEMLHRQLTHSVDEAASSWSDRTVPFNDTVAWVLAVGICVFSILFVRKCWPHVRQAWSRAISSSLRAI